MRASVNDGRHPLWAARSLERFRMFGAGAALEREAGQLFLWLPVALAAGVGAYFSLPLEPRAGVIVVAALALAVLLHAASHRTAPAVPALLAAAVAGFLLAKLDTTISGTPVIASATEPARFAGAVEDIDRRKGRSAVLTVRLMSMHGVAAAELPKRIRLTAPMRQELRVGSHVAGTARLFPLLTPVAPGAYDYGRAQWLRGIGATGRALAPLEVDDRHPTGVILEVRHRIGLLRSSIGRRIAAVLPGSVGAFATALITGDRDDIPPSTTASLQASGLAHVISISGLHMSLVAGAFFWIARALLALSPSLASHRPIKKWAAAGALAIGAFYLLLSGAEVPTQRSYIMLAIMFGAIFVDRPALSLRNVAVAALIVLLVEPASALDAGFQMSFLAVAGLVSLYELAGERRWFDPAAEPRSRLVPQVARRALKGLVLAAATSLVAGLCTAPVAAFHFNRIAVYGLLANLLAMPVVSFIVMPTALVATLLMPLGLEPLPLVAMGFGLDAVMAISDWTQNLPGAQVVAASHGSGGALLMSLGLLWLCLLKTSLRWWGSIILVTGLLLAGARAEPDVLIERTARNVAIRNSGGDLVPALARRSGFAVERWLLSDGDDARPADAHRRPGWSCKPEICFAAVKGRKLAYLTDKAEQDFSCPEVDVVIAAFPLRGRCRNVARRIDRFDVWRNGAHAIYIEGSSMKIETAREKRGIRPWVIEPKPRKKVNTAAKAVP